jgi:hypothetical protein
MDKDHNLVFPAWFLTLAVNAICAAEVYRVAASAPGVEYGLEIEILPMNGALHVYQYGSGFGGFNEVQATIPGPVVFPRYSVGSRQEFIGVIRLIERDMWNSGGRDWNERLEVDFAPLLS